jgi:DNA-binding NarL/FixJ family response regulator
MALRRILAGGTFMPGRCPVAARSEERVTIVNTRREACRDLSRRQTAILLCAIGGQPNKVIASDFGIAEGTVKAHLSAAFKVLGVHNRTEAVFAAARLGLEPNHWPAYKTQ